MRHPGAGEIAGGIGVADFTAHKQVLLHLDPGFRVIDTRDIVDAVAVVTHWLIGGSIGRLFLE